MATPLDVTALGHFSGLFPFLLVMVLSYAIFMRTPWFKEKPGIAALLSTILAFMTLFSTVAIKTINLMMPWFVLFLIFGVLLIFSYMAFGVKEESIVNILTTSEYAGTFGIWVIAIMLIIGLGSMFQVINEQQPLTGLQAGEQVEVQPQNGEYGFWQTLFHPKILGMILILLVAFFAVGRMVQM